jgi:soluble P-type ATPase
MKPGIAIDIPGFGPLELRTLVSDYTGTLSCGGRLSRGVGESLTALADLLDIHILTADTFGTAERELAGLPLAIHRLETAGLDRQKAEFVAALSPNRVAAFGNGNNDRLLLQAVKEAGGLAVAVDNGEGCAVDALQNANLLIHGAANALALLLESNRLKATLRF